MPRKAVRTRRAVSRPPRSTAVAARIARPSISYIVTFVAEVLHTTSLDVLDALITLTISSGSLARIQTGVSRNAVSRALNVPLETVRRRVAVLLEKKVIRERGGLFVPETRPLGALDNHGALLALNAQKVRRLFFDLKAQGVKLV